MADKIELDFKVGGFPPNFSVDAIIAACRRDRDQRRLDVLGSCPRPRCRPNRRRCRRRRRRAVGRPGSPAGGRAGAPGRRARGSGRPSTSPTSRPLVAAADELRAAFPDPWIRQYSVKANDVAAIVARASAAWASARTSCRAASGPSPDGPASQTAGSRSRASARPMPTSGRRSGRRPRGDPLRWVAIESADEAAALAAIARRRRRRPARRPASGSTRRSSPRPSAAWRSVRGASKFGDDRDEIAGAIEAGAEPRARSGARGIHLHVGSQLGAVDAWRDAVRRALALAALLARLAPPSFDTLDVGGGFPVPPVGDAPSARPSGSRASCPGCSTRSRRTRPDAPRDRARPGPRRAGRVARRPRAARARAGRSAGRPRRRA